MAFKMKGFSAFTKKDKVDYKSVTPQTKKKEDEYVPQSQRENKEYTPQTVKNKEVKKKDKKEYTPQTEKPKVAKGEPQLREVDRLENYINAIYENEYSDAKEDNDRADMDKYEKQMLGLVQELENLGEEYDDYDISEFDFKLNEIGKIEKKKA